jgi:hypothetical protein
VADLLFVVITFAFFAICVAYVRVCDRIIGPDPATPPAEHREDADREEVTV